MFVEVFERAEIRLTLPKELHL